MALRIVDPGAVQAREIGRRPRPGAAAGGGFALPALEGEGGPPIGQVAAAPSLMPAGALFALQGEADPIAERRKALRRAGAMTEELEALRRELLEGDISPARLHALRDLARAGREQALDPALRELIDAIETRVQVELAKLDTQA